MKTVFGAAACLLLGGCALAEGAVLGGEGPTYIDGAELREGRSFRAELVCEGEGSTAVAQVKLARPVREPVQLRLNGAASRIRLPVALVPSLGSGGDGWFAVEGVVVNERYATGGVQLNMLTRAQVSYDRGTGDLRVDATGLHYRGKCTPAAGEAAS